MLSIDEAIAHAREVASRKFDDKVHCIRCAEEHEQLAEWLEELKAYREIGTVEECRNSILEIPKAYNKAIDDFVHKIKEHHYVLSDVINSTDYGMFTVGIEQIAEELKE